jgi:hypothetical protein
MAGDRRISTYREFWPHYLREHAQAKTRAIHFLGTGIATAAVMTLAVTGNAWFAALALIGGYGPAWTAHFFVEKNRPATFTYPLWSLLSDYRMAWSWLTGHLSQELDRAGVAHR